MVGIWTDSVIAKKLIGNAMDRIGKPELARKHEKVFLIWNSGKLYFTFTRPGQL